MISNREPCTCPPLPSSGIPKKNLKSVHSEIKHSKNQKTLTIKKKRRTSSKLPKKVSVEGEELHRFTKQLLFALEDSNGNAVRSARADVYKVIGDPVKETSHLRKFHAKDCPNGCELPKVVIEETKKKNKTKECFHRIPADNHTLQHADLSPRLEPRVSESDLENFKRNFEENLTKNLNFVSEYFMTIFQRISSRFLNSLVLVPTHVMRK